MSEFFLDDGLSGLFSLTPTVVLQNLSRAQIVAILQDLGATDIVEQENQLILPTICHNPLEHEKSHKLYYYYDSKLFSCYTECGHSFNLYELVRKVYAINDHEIGFYEAFNYVMNFFDGAKQIIQAPVEPIGNRYARKLSVVDLPEYNKNVLSIFRKDPATEWLNEGISKEAMARFNILFSMPKLKIIIPHYDLKGRLVGIRGRALEEYEVENFGKYMPVKVENTFYTHHLSRNLYGIEVAKKAIKRTRRAVLFEGEKSVLKMWDYYGDDSVAVAVCGSNIHKVQIDLLVKKLGVFDITIAFDKEYQHLRTEESEAYKAKLIAMCQKYSNYANFSFLYDMEGLLEEKDSPVDKGKEIYERLYDMRVKVR